MSDRNYLQVHYFQGNKEEELPNARVGKLVVKEGVEELPDHLCDKRILLQEICLPNGLKTIGDHAFRECLRLLKLSIRNTVQSIGGYAFHRCRSMRAISFECSKSAPHQLQAIEQYAFSRCESLKRIKLPSSVASVGTEAFSRCFALMEADLSKTGLTKISICAFLSCSSLQTVSLPNTLTQICRMAFAGCKELVTVVVPLGSQSIRVGEQSFHGCKRLANLALPRDSIATKTSSFLECTALHECYGGVASRIVAGLIARFEGFPIHRVCYDHSSMTVQELRQCVKNQFGVGGSLVDNFGMTPFHTLFSNIDPSTELLDALLDSLPNQILKLKDANQMRPLDYLFKNWTEGASRLAARTLEKSMIARLARWGAISWRDVMQFKVHELLAEEDKSRRKTLCDDVYSTFDYYEKLETTSVLEMTLWKWKVKSGWTSGSDGSKRQALDREGCRCLCGSDVVIPPVATFLGMNPYISL